MSSESKTSISVHVPAVKLLLSAATPFLRIVSVNASARWLGKKKLGDPRNGPWCGSTHQVVDERVWRTSGECLYFVTDEVDTLKYVGQSKDRLANRWRTPPAICAVTKRDLGNPFIFHNRAWQWIEAEFLSEGGPGKRFLVSVLHGEALLRAVAQSNKLAGLSQSISPGWHLARLVEEWLCCNPTLQAGLWNVAGTSKRGRKKISTPATQP